MSYVQSNIQFPDRSHGFTEAEAEALTQEKFDKLPICDQISLYNNHRGIYDKLTGKQTANDTDTQADAKTKVEDFATEFERIVDNAFIRVLGHKAGESN